jgi:peptidoglycan/LPS O-acetylase OafA/YrhL
LETFRRLDDRASKFFSTAGTFSFGIFFLHSYVITASRVIGEHWIGHPPLGSVLALAGAFACSFAVTILLVGAFRWCIGPGRSRHLIGT